MIQKTSDIWWWVQGPISQDLFVFKCLVTQIFMTNLTHWSNYSLAQMASFCPTLLCSYKLWICLSVHHLTPVTPSPHRRAWVLHNEQINTLTLLPGYLQQFSLQRLWAGWLSADVGQMHSSYLCVCVCVHACTHTSVQRCCGLVIL